MDAFTRMGDRSNIPVMAWQFTHGHSRRAGGDVAEGITCAVEWVAAELPVLALNIIVTTATDLWALRYPANHPLYILERDPAAEPAPAAPLDARSRRIHSRSTELSVAPSVLFGTEPVNHNPGWRPMASGEAAAPSTKPAAPGTTPHTDAASLDTWAVRDTASALGDAEAVAAASMSAVVTNDGAGCWGSGCPSAVSPSQFTTLPSV